MQDAGRWNGRYICVGLLILVGGRLETGVGNWGEINIQRLGACGPAWHRQYTCVLTRTTLHTLWTSVLVGVHVTKSNQISAYETATLLRTLASLS